MLHPYKQLTFICMVWISEAQLTLIFPMFSVHACDDTAVFTLNNVHERLTTSALKSQNDEVVSDNYLTEGWYRPVNETHQFYLADNTTNLYYGHCNTYYPTFLRGKLM